MNHYKHLTIEEREKLFFFAAKGENLSRIAKRLGRSRSTIYREYARNANRKAEYLPSTAQQQYEMRRQRCRRRTKLQDPEILALVKDRILNHQWSPEQIAGWLRLNREEQYISYTTIYRAIYAGMFDTPQHRSQHQKGGMRKHLRHKGKRRHTKDFNDRRGKTSIDHEIDERPQEANDRSRIGDWEADTVAGKLGGPCLITLVDRKSGYLLCKKVPNKKPKEVAEGMIELLKSVPCKSVTPDRGHEFDHYRDVTAELGVLFYFARPHHPWQRGTNENTNGLLREYFPKQTDLSNISDDWIQCKVRELNLRPRKRLGFKSPLDIFLLHLT